MPTLVSKSGGVMSANKPLSKRDLILLSKVFNSLGGLSSVTTMCLLFPNQTLRCQRI